MTRDPQLPLNRAQLLPQIEVPLHLLDPVLNLRLDSIPHIQHMDLL